MLNAHDFQVLLMLVISKCYEQNLCEFINKTEFKNNLVFYKILLCSERHYNTI